MAPRSEPRQSISRSGVQMPSHMRIRLELGLLSILLALCGFGLMHWYAVLLGWGIAETFYAVQDMRNWSNE